MLPKDSEERAASFQRMSEAEKAGIMKAIKEVPVSMREDYVQRILKDGGLAGEFVAHVLGKRTPQKGESPNDKQRGPTQTK